MLINLFGNWINPQAIISITSATNAEGNKVSKVVFMNNDESIFKLEFTDKTTAEVAVEINTAITANRKIASESRSADRGFSRSGGGDRGGYKGGGDRGGYKGGGDRGGRGGDRGGYKGSSDRGDRGGYKGGGDRDRGDRGGYKGDRGPREGGENREERVKKEFGDRKEGKFEGGKKFEPRSRGGDFKPKKRKDY